MATSHRMSCRGKPPSKGPATFILAVLARLKFLEASTLKASDGIGRSAPGGRRGTRHPVHPHTHPTPIACPVTSKGLKAGAQREGSGRSRKNHQRRIQGPYAVRSLPEVGSFLSSQVLMKRWCDIPSHIFTKKEWEGTVPTNTPY